METTYLSLPEDAFEENVPSYNRRWLKTTILRKLPHKATSQSPVIKIMNKPSLIYSWEACEKDTVAMMTKKPTYWNLTILYFRASSVCPCQVIFMFVGFVYLTMLRSEGPTSSLWCTKSPNLSTLSDEFSLIIQYYTTGGRRGTGLSAVWYKENRTSA